MKVPIFAITMTAWLATQSSIFAQHHLGLSVHYGDRLSFEPPLQGFFRPRRSFSPTLTYLNRQRINPKFNLALGAQVGIAGYQLVPVQRDTLGFSGDTSPFADYGIFVARLEVVPGSNIRVGPKKIFLGLGAGMSYYYLFFPYTTMSVLVAKGGMASPLFSAEAEAPESGSTVGYVKGMLYVDLSQRWSFALSYSRHFRPVLHGAFEFYHTATPASGTFRWIPSGWTATALYRLSKDRRSVS